MPVAIVMTLSEKDEKYRGW